MTITARDYMGGIRDTFTPGSGLGQDVLASLRGILSPSTSVGNIREGLDQRDIGRVIQGSGQLLALGAGSALGAGKAGLALGAARIPGLARGAAGLFGRGASAARNTVPAASTVKNALGSWRGLGSAIAGGAKGALGSPGRALTTAGILGGGSALYNRFNKPDQDALLELLGPSSVGSGSAGIGSAELDLMERSNQRQREVVDRILNDTTYQEGIQNILNQARESGTQYVEAKAPALRREFEQYGSDVASQAEALRRLAAATSGEISGGGEAAAADIEGMLYGGEPVSGVSGLTPVSSALADMPAAVRQDAGTAAQAALRDLSSSAEARQFAADQAAQYGAGYAGEMGDEMALQMMALDRLAQQQMFGEQSRRRGLADEFELEQARQLGQMEFQTGMESIAETREKEDVVRRAIASGKVNEYVREWQSLNAQQLALLMSSGVDFREYVFLRESGGISGFKG